MPLEGHFNRVNTPLRRLNRRERNVVIAGVAATFVALAALLLATAGDSQPPPAPGCIRVAVAGRTGGELVHACGMEAREVCARSATLDDPQSRAIVAGCEDRAIRPLGSSPAGSSQAPPG
jgi:predicted metal-binding membrane protein